MLTQKSYFVSNSQKKRGKNSTHKVEIPAQAMPFNMVCKKKRSIYLQMPLLMIFGAKSADRQSRTIMRRCWRMSRSVR